MLICALGEAHLTHTYLVNTMNIGKTIKSGVHGVEHVDYLNWFTGCADVSERDHVTEKDGAHFELTCKKKCDQMLMTFTNSLSHSFAGCTSGFITCLYSFALFKLVGDMCWQHGIKKLF